MQFCFRKVLNNSLERMATRFHFVSEIDFYSITMDAPMKGERKHLEKYLFVLETNSEAKKCEVSAKAYSHYQVGDEFVIK